MITTDSKPVTACDYVSEAIDDFIYIKGIVNRFIDLDSVYNYLDKMEGVEVFDKLDYAFKFHYNYVIGEVERDPFTDYPQMFSEFDIHDENGNYIASRANEIK